MKIPRLVLGSRNAKKCEEIQQLLSPHSIDVASVAEFPSARDVVEDGDSFTANARKKAIETAIAIGEWVLAEDSGLCVDALDGAPGIMSARYAGGHGDDEANNRKLIADLADIPESKRTAHYVCHVSLAGPDGIVHLDSEAVCRGVIVSKARGSNGFGYDPHFLIPEFGKTFGELGPAVKQALSHRARAFHRFIPALLRLIHS